MKAFTHYEVYQARLGQWAMVARFNSAERELALKQAREMESNAKQLIAVVEETEDLSGNECQAQIIHRSAEAGRDIRPPAMVSDFGSRIFMMILNSLTVGAIVVVLAALVLSRTNVAAGFNLALVAAFVVSSLLTGLILVRVYLPIGLILWRAKDVELRKRTIYALAHGRVVAPSTDPLEPLPQNIAPITPPAATPNSFQTEVSAAPPPAALDATPVGVGVGVTATPPIPTPQPIPEPAAFADQARAAIVDRLTATLAAFTDECLVTLAVSRPTLSPVERLGFNLYLMGAATAVAERNDLDSAIARGLIESALIRSQVSPEEATAFFNELTVAGERPRYRRMMDEGKNAAAPLFGEVVPGPRPLISELLTQWSDPAQRTAEPQQMTFLLTDIVGSTALTSEIGNAGAQRVVRAHNAIARAAAKAFRGREVKHTGDGMLLIFPDSIAGARAAIDIQQEATTYARDNPTAPLALRVGLHIGEAVFEDDEYYGPAITIVGGLCGLVNTAEICCSVAIRQKVPASNFKFEGLGIQNVKGANGPIEVLKLLWEPKWIGKKPALEYRQIGTTPPVTTRPATTEP